MITAGDIRAFLETKAPAETAEDWDNPGLLVGTDEQPVTAAVVCLDITPAAVDYAVQKGATLIISHHPVIFRPLKRLSGNSVPYRLAAAGMAALALHTNLDAAAGGVNDGLAAVLGLEEVTVLADGLCRQGTLSQPLSPADFAAHVARALKTPVRAHEGTGPVRTVAVCGGSGGELLLEGAAGADAIVTGELRHHEWLAAAEAGQTAVEAGHYETEVGVVDTLVRWLTAEFPALSVLPFADTAPYYTATLK